MLKPGSRAVVTGAFSYTGKYITRRLLRQGVEVSTLTGHPRRGVFEQEITSHPLDFSDRDGLARALDGADVLFNTYWIRFPYGGMTHQRAVENSLVLFEAAARAGVRRVDQTSIANPSCESELPYYRGKAQVEEGLRNSGLSFAILRPTVLFGPEDILINNIAWFVRKFPVFGVPGDGCYGIQPIYVDDFAGLMVEAAGSSDDFVADAVGPEMFTFRDLIPTVAKHLNRKVHILGLPPLLVYMVTRLTGYFVNDVILTRDEIRGLMSNLLISSAPPRGTTPLTRWLSENSRAVGSGYASELGRHY